MKDADGQRCCTQVRANNVKLCSGLVPRWREISVAPAAQFRSGTVRTRLTGNWQKGFVNCEALVIQVLKY